jgi:hypothetical protein
MSAAQQAIAQLANDAVVENLEAKNESEWYDDKGAGVPKPKPEEEEEEEEEDDKKDSNAADAKSKFAKKDLEYPDLQLIICRRGRLVPKEGESVPAEDIIGYVGGAEGTEPCLTVRLTNVKAGEYFILYRPDFKPRHIVKRLNVVVYSKFMKRLSFEEQEELAARAKSLASLNASSAQVGQASQAELAGAKSSAPGLSRGPSAVSSRSRSGRDGPWEYDADWATEIERLDASSFKRDFFEQMESINYDR